MGVYIKGMEMPKSCGFCFFRIGSEALGDYCGAPNQNESVWCEFQKRPGNCPLIPVPPHGRLIDADAFLQLCFDYAMTPDDMELCERLEYALTKAHTIIPAAPAEEGE